MNVNPHRRAILFMGITEQFHTALSGILKSCLPQSKVVSVQTLNEALAHFKETTIELLFIEVSSENVEGIGPRTIVS